MRPRDPDSRRGSARRGRPSMTLPAMTRSAISYFPLSGVEVDTPFELFQHLRFARPCKFRYILDIDVRITSSCWPPVPYARRPSFDLRRIEGDGMVEDVGLVHDTVGVAFQREYLVGSRIHPYPVDILRFVQLPEPLHEVVVKAVQHYAQRGVRGQCIGLHVVEVDNRCPAPRYRATFFTRCSSGRSSGWNIGRRVFRSLRYPTRLSLSTMSVPSR